MQASTPTGDVVTLAVLGPDDSFGEHTVFTGASVRAATVFRFGDVGLRIPRVAVVLSVEEQIRLEADLLLRRAP